MNFRFTIGAVSLVLMAGMVAPVQSADKKPAAHPEKSKPAAENVVGPMDQPLLMVDGQPVSSRDFANFLQGNPSIVSRAANTEQGKADALRELVTGYLLRKEMYAEGLIPKGRTDLSPKEVSSAYEKLAEKHFPLPPNPDDKAGFAYYQDHQSEFGIPTMLRVNEVFFKVPDNADAAVQDAVKARAEKVLQRLESGEKFTAVATEVTENPIAKVAGGDRGFVDPNEEPWMQPALNNLKKGDRTGVLRAPKGFVILEVSDIRPGLISPYANVRDQVIKNLKDAEQKKLRDAYVRELAKKAKIEIMMPHIKPLFPQGMFP